MIYPEFITEEERLTLLAWIEGLYLSRCAQIGADRIPELHLGIKLIDPPSTERPTNALIDCIFGANPIGNTQGEDVPGVVPPEVYRVKQRIMHKFNLTEYDRRKTFMNYFLPGYGLGEHRHYPPKGFADFRTNLMIQMPKGAEPIAGDRVFNVAERGLWVFNANLPHSTQKVQDNLPRVVIGFGWDVPDWPDGKHWDGDPVPDPGPRWKSANIRRVNNEWVSDYYKESP